MRHPASLSSPKPPSPISPPPPPPLYNRSTMILRRRRHRNLRFGLKPPSIFCLRLHHQFLKPQKAIGIESRVLLKSEEPCGISSTCKKGNVWKKDIGIFSFVPQIQHIGIRLPSNSPCCFFFFFFFFFFSSSPSPSSSLTHTPKFHYSLNFRMHCDATGHIYPPLLPFIPIPVNYHTSTPKTKERKKEMKNMAGFDSPGRDYDNHVPRGKALLYTLFCFCLIAACILLFVIRFLNRTFCSPVAENKTPKASKDTAPNNP